MATRLALRKKYLKTKKHAASSQTKATCIESVLSQIPTPAYELDEQLLQKNGQRLLDIQHRTGCKLNLALKGFSGYHVFDTLKPFISGMSASSVYEGRLAHEEFGGEIHMYSPAYTQQDIEDISKFSSHVVFNSFSQYEQYAPSVLDLRPDTELGIRLNPEFSLSDHAMFDPCAQYSRFGVTAAQVMPSMMEFMDGIHIHALCQQGAEGLAQLMDVVESKFGHILNMVKWVNFGGGHHLTHPDYNVDLLCDLVNAFQHKYGVQVILEPGEAVVYKTGFFVATVVDVIRNDIDIAILDASAKAHTPDIIEMESHHDILNAAAPSKKQYTYRLGGITCQANDVFGDYSFDTPLKPGQKLVFTDMAQYTMVKNTNFNGVRLPSITKIDTLGDFSVIKTFGYDDFKKRC